MLDGLRGENILFADLQHWREVLLQSAWVEDAAFRRLLPSTIEVQIQERTPIAIGRIGTALFLVDERGATIDEYSPQYSGLDLPIVDGLSTAAGAKGVDRARAALAARLIVSLRQKPAIAEKLSQVDVSDLHNATILLNDDPAELRVGDTRFLERVESYLSLASALRAKVPEMDYVDLRFDGRVYVRPAGKADKSSVGSAHAVADRAQGSRRR
jgi:cell division protein FtsQ